jgi:hypothetical protein
MFELGTADDETKILEEAADLVLKIPLDFDQQCPACQKRPNRVAIELARTALNQPVCMMRAMPAASLRTAPGAFDFTNAAIASRDGHGTTLCGLSPAGSWPWPLVRALPRLAERSQSVVPRGAAMPQRLVAGGAQLRPFSQAVPISKRSWRRCSPSATTNICGGRRRHDLRHLSRA